MEKSVTKSDACTVFEQRGKKLHIGRFTVGKVYLYEFWGDCSKRCIFMYESKTNMGTAISTNCLVFYSPEKIEYRTETTLVGKFNHGFFHHATKNQIDLLELYKSDK